MIKPSVVNKLKTYNNSSFNILSVYLGEDTVHAPTGELLMTQLHSLMHQQLTKEDRATFEGDITRIEKYLNQYIPSARSVIFFSAGDDVWEVVNLEFSLPASLSIDTSPNLDPLTQALQKYSKYLVLLVDREKARVFTVEQGEITDHSDYKGGYVPHKVQATGRDESISDTDANARHNDVMLGRHIDIVVEKIAKFAKTHNIHFVILGGHAQMFKKVTESLPVDLRAKLVGHFVTEVDIPLSEILHKSKKIAATVPEEQIATRKMYT